MKKIGFCIIFLILIKSALAQEVSMKVVFNNTKDIETSSDLINKINSEFVNKENLQSAMNTLDNFYNSLEGVSLTDKNLLVYVAFLDKDYFAGLKLKESEKINFDNYITQWQEEYGNQSAVLFLFLKDGSNYNFNKLIASTKLEEEHLFPEVMDFINLNLSGNTENIIKNGTKYLANAIKPVWSEDKMTNSEALTKNERYWQNRINFFHNSWASTFLDLKPIGYKTGLKRVFLINSGSKDTLKPSVNIYANENEFKGSNIDISGFGYEYLINGKLLDYLFFGDELLLLELTDNSSEHQSYILKLIQAIDNEKKYSSNLKVSEWNWEKSSSGVFTLKNYENVGEFRDGDKLELVKRSLKDEFNEGDPIPVIHPWYPRTFCNVLASDMSKTILFPNSFSGSSTSNTYAPWGKHQAAAYLHDEIKDNKNGKFKNVNFDKAWKYTNAGFIVYLTSYNRRYYSGATTNKYKYSGHIATCYPTSSYVSNNYLDANVIQAGLGEAQVKSFKYCFGSSYIENVSANIYLGYILK
ncbi:MAG: hypothetical protein PF485_14945 [Bacteroidales bacterium]|jgi:hypothetical protein|nr:hypothetical protein [Bacteroidales bacterium]